MFFHFLLLLLGTLLFSSSLEAQNRIGKHQDTLKKIRDEILSVEREIEENKKKETSVLYMLSTLDLDMDLARSVIHNLKKERSKQENQIAAIEKNLEVTQNELAVLKEQLSKRLIYSYKYGRMKDIELLFSARSINDGLLWLEYQKRLAENDLRSFLKIQEKETEIARDRDLLALELQKKKELLREKVTEERKLKEKKSKRQKVLASVRQNTNLLRQQLTEKENAAKEIQRLIVQMEKSPRRVPMPKPETLFVDLKGRMIWPARGEIVTRFGKYKHPELKTITENIGVDIAAKLNSPVLVVARGTVTAITWQRGRGNIVIVSHYGGYYSVYAHIGEILVNLSEEVEMGQEIGSVGESGSLKGPVLHFEIWKGTDKLNPESWFGKST